MPLPGASLGAPSSLRPSPLLRPSRLLNTSVVVAADIGQAPAPPRPDPLITAVVGVVVAVWESGEGEEPVIEAVVPEGKPVMSHAETRKRAGMADSGTAESGAHASKATRAYARAAHPDWTHPTTAHAATEHGPTAYPSTAHASHAAAHPAVAHSTTHSVAAHSTAAVATTSTSTHSGRCIKRRTGDDGRRGGQDDHCFTHHD